MTRAAEWVAGRSPRADDSVVVTTPPLPARAQHVHSRSGRLGDEPVLDGSVSFMASSARVEYSANLPTAVVAKAAGLLTSVTRTSMHPPELL